MGLFDRKRTSFYDAQPFYTIGGQRTLLVVGLGNPGEKYLHTRHNAGFMALDYYRKAKDFGDWIAKKDLQCIESSGVVANTKVILIKPQTFMNESGASLQKVQQFYKVGNQDTVVVYDELDVDFGAIRTRVGGSAGGHNGIKSLIKHCGEEFGRVRIGIGPKVPEQIDSADFVLQNFSQSQTENLPKILRESAALIDEATAGPLQEQTIKVDF